MKSIGEDPQNDLSFLDPERHGPLADHARKVRDAYTERKRAQAALVRAEEGLLREARAYAAERLLLFVRLLQDRRLACCLHCERVVPQEEMDWLFVRHVWVTDEGYDASVKETFLVRACAACRRVPAPGETVPFLWIQDNSLRAHLTPARKAADGQFEILTWSSETQGPAWARLDTRGVVVHPRTVPRRVPNDLPADIESSLPPQIDIQRAGKEHFGFDPVYAGVQEGALLLITKDRQEKL